MPAAKVSGTVRSKNPLKGAVEILPERLYYAALKQPPPSHNILATTPRRGKPSSKQQDDKEKPPKKQIHFFNIDNELIYWNFFLDFGPLNLGQLSRFSMKLNDKLRKFPVVCYYSNTVPAKRANAIFLICAWQLFYLKRTPTEAYRGFDMANLSAERGGTMPPVSASQGATTLAPLPPFHDASPCACTYDLTVLDCLDGLAKAKSMGFVDLDDFDVEEYEHFEQVENGDLNWIVKDKILAFAGPSYERHVSPEGYCTLAPADYIPYFQKRRVSLVVRLNKKAYHEQDFVNAGIRHVEHFFLDGSCPPMKILYAVLEDFERVPANEAFAVHCKAGLGRTGSCIGAYMMKHYHFSASQAIAWMRICRPGCVIGPQQHFLQQLQERMWHEGRNIIQTSTTGIPGICHSMTNSSSDTSPTVTVTSTSEPAPMEDVLEEEELAAARSSGTTSGASSTPSHQGEAATGRAGQAEGLLAARQGRNRHAASAAASGQTQQNQPVPITPELREREKAVAVTPDSSSEKRLWFT